MAFNLLTALGIDPGTITLMEQQGANLQKYLNDLKKKCAGSKGNRNITKASSGMGQLQQTAVGLAQTIMSNLGPRIEEILDKCRHGLRKPRLDQYKDH